MDNNKTSKSKKSRAFSAEIDLTLIFKAIWKQLWIIILAAIVIGAGMFTYTKLMVKPTYRAYFTAIVNNKPDFSQGGLSSSDVYASQALVKTYSEIITSRHILTESAKELNLNYNYNSLSRMVSTEVGSDTEIITVYVVAATPETAYELANTIKQESLDYTAEIVEGSSMKIIDDPEIPTVRYNPSYIKSAILGALAGAFLGLLFILIKFFINDKINNENELNSRYTVPVVGVIPDYLSISKNKNNYYYYSYEKKPSKKERKEKA